MSKDALDLFSGARGWDVVAEPLGWTTFGVENWEPARRTAALNGFRHVDGLHENDIRNLHVAPGQYDA